MTDKPKPGILQKLLATIDRLEREQMITPEFAADQRATVQSKMFPEDELPPVVEPPRATDRWTR